MNEQRNVKMMFGIKLFEWSGWDDKIDTDEFTFKGRMYYKVTISESVSFNELTSRCEITDQEGDIYTMVEK